MTYLSSPVYSGADRALGDVFPTVLPEPEKLIYEHVRDATGSRIVFPDDPTFYVTLPAQFDQTPLLNFYPDGVTQWYAADPARKRHPKEGEWPVIPVSRGTALPYPGTVPAISVGLANDSEDSATDSEGGGFAGDAYAYDAQGNVVGSAAYFSQPLYASVVVQLIHENRDERDRLHNELRRVLAPLTRRLPQREPQIHRTKVSSEKQDVPMDESPYVMYVSVFTVEVWFEMLQAMDVVGTEAIITGLPLTVAIDPTIVPIEDDD